MGFWHFVSGIHEAIATTKRGNEDREFYSRQTENYGKLFTGSLETLGECIDELGEMIESYTTKTEGFMLRADKCAIIDSSLREFNSELELVGVADSDIPDVVSNFPDMQRWEELKVFTNARKVGILTGSVVAGSGAGVGLYTGVGYFGTASTGVAIKTLSGIAKHKAIMAQLGGGSKLAGGLGILGGTVTLVSVVGVAAVGVGAYLAYQGLADLDDRTANARNNNDRNERLMSRHLANVEGYYFTVDEILSAYFEGKRYYETLLNMSVEELRRQPHTPLECLNRLADLVTVPLFIQDDDGETVTNYNEIQKRINNIVKGK